MRLLFVLLTVSIALPLWAQQRVPCRVRFTDKGPESFAPGSALYQSTLALYHPRAIERRRSVGFNPILNEDDKPLYVPYKQSILAISDSLLSELVWLNAVIVGLDPAEQQRVQALPFVLSVKPTSSLSYTQLREIDCSPVVYGPSEQQLLSVNVKQLHDAGLFGQGARIGVIDNGFRWREMSTLRHAQVEREYDFVYRDTITANQPGDVDAQDAHGSCIFSVIGSWSHDSVSGVAPFATYLLAKSEDMRYERRIEEELFVEAMHWVELNGADISSSSLGYLAFDSTDASTPYELLDGKTTYAARAINLAAQRGMLCVTAAGNYGRPKTLITPADADSAITVGAMAIGADTLWAYSSKGPTADGRIKPDITAQGMGVHCQTPAGNLVRSSGTSLATPIVAGQLGLLRGLYPDMPLQQLRDALYANSMFPTQRDSGMGHGVANTVSTARFLGPGIGRPNVVIVSTNTSMFIPIFSSNAVSVKVTAVNRTTKQSTEIVARPIEGVWYYVEYPESTFTGGDTLDIRVVATDEALGRVRAYPHDQSTFQVVRNLVDLSCAVRLPTTIARVDEHPTALQPTVLEQPIEAGSSSIVVSLPWTDVLKPLARMYALTGQEVPATAQHEGHRLYVHPSQPLQPGVYVITLLVNSRHSVISFVVK